MDGNLSMANSMVYETKEESEEGIERMMKHEEMRESYLAYCDKFCVAPSDPDWHTWQAASTHQAVATRREVIKQCADKIPSNWIDVELSKIGRPPWDCTHIEMLLTNIKASIESLSTKEGE